MTEIDYQRVRNAVINLGSRVAELAGQPLDPNAIYNLGECGQVKGFQLIQDAQYYYQLSGGVVRPQLAALVFDITGNYKALDFYFPIVNSLKYDDIYRNDFYHAIAFIAGHPNLDLHVYAEHKRDVTAVTPPAVRHMIAGHLAEVFYYRRDIIERFLATPRHFSIYVNHAAFEQDGGLAGGDYNFGREAIELEMSRLFEGYNGQNPGVAPFLHELGHMLDHFDGGSGRMGQCEGMLPGMSPNDGPIFSPQARQNFIQGKRMEKERYQAYQDGRAASNDPVPVGHPYVFQTDGEFIAGYLEMFFRNPNYFASQNPVLYGGFAELLHQDPRRYWPEDFPGYVGENRKAYLNGQRPTPQNISIPYQ